RATKRSTAATRPGFILRSAEVGASAAMSEPDVDVIVVVGLREAGATEPEQGDDLLRLNLYRQSEQRLDRVLGDAADPLVPCDRKALQGRDVDCEAVDVRRDDARSGEEAVAGHEAGHRHMVEPDHEVPEDDEHANVDAAGD